MTEHVLMEAKSGYALFSVPSICVTISTIVQYRNINIVSIRSCEIKILRQRMIDSTGHECQPLCSTDAAGVAADVTWTTGDVPLIRVNDTVGYSD